MKTTNFKLCASGVLFLALALAGCESTDAPQSASATVDDVSVPTEQAAQAEAERLITEENFDEQLAQLEKEIEADEGGEP